MDEVFPKIDGLYSWPENKLLGSNFLDIRCVYVCWWAGGEGVWWGGGGGGDDQHNEEGANHRQMPSILLKTKIAKLTPRKISDAK